MPPQTPDNKTPEEQELQRIADRALEIMEASKSGKTPLNYQGAVEAALKEAGSIDPRRDMRALTILELIYKQKHEKESNSQE